MRSASRLLLALAALFAAACQQLDPRDNPLDPRYDGPRGGVRGKVVLRSGKAVTYSTETGGASVDYGGVRVYVDRIPGAVTETAVDGTYDLRGVPVGAWSVSFEHPGYVTQTVRGVAFRRDEAGEIAPVELQEIIAGTLVFGSSREGWPSVFGADPYGREVRNLSVLPLQSNACRYLEYKGTPALVVDTQFVVYEEGGEYKSASGVYAASYPDLEPLALFEGDARRMRPMFTRDGKIVFEANYGGDRFIALAGSPEALEGDWEALRITGAKGDKWAETLPALSDSGRLAYVRTGEDETQMPWYEIRVLDDFDAPLGALVWRRSLLSILEHVSDSRAFDFDGDGTDDIVKFGALFEEAGLPAFTAGIDWSYTGATSVADYLEGPQPDGVQLDSVALLIELIQLGEIRELAWLPDDDTLVFVDRVQSQPGYKKRVLWPIKNRGAAVTDWMGRPVTDAASGRTTDYYFDIDFNGAYSAAVDRPFFYNDPGSWVDNMVLEFKRIESQVLRKVRASKPEAPEQYVFGASPNEWIFSPAVSPDGRRVAMALGPVENVVESLNFLPVMTQGDIVTVDPDNGFVTRITTDGLNNRAPCWAPH